MFAIDIGLGARFTFSKGKGIYAKMAACDFLKFGAILFAVFTACTATDSIAMMVDEPLPSAGDNITITFTANGLIGGEFIKLEKVLDDDEPVVISTNHILESPFSTMERYQMKLDPDATNAAENKFVFVFTIAGIKEEDSGVYRGVAAEDTTVNAIVEVNVRKDPDVIQLFVGEAGAEVELTDDQTLDFDEEVSQSVRCVVSGSNPPATVTMYRGDNDITDQFEHSTSQEKTPTDNKGLDIISNTVTQTAPAVLLDFSFSGNPLKCVATMDGSETQLTRSVNIKFKGFKPVIHCQNHTSYNGETNVNITCHVMASPPVEPENAHIYWFANEGENEPSDLTQKLSSEEPSWGRYRASFTREGDQATYMVLKFERMFPQMFRSYYFVAKNDMGTAERQIYMERDTSQEPTSRGSQVALSVLVISLMSLVHLVAQ